MPTRAHSDMVAEVAAWRREQCSRACPGCARSCCTGRLSPRVPCGSELFAGLAVLEPGAPLVPRPYLEPQRGWGRRGHRLIGPCPQLDGEGRCSAYDHPERPSDCHEYPVHLQRVLGGLGGTVLHAEESCPMVAEPATRSKLEALARRLGVDLILHPDTSEPNR